MKTRKRRGKKGKPKRKEDERKRPKEKGMQGPKG